MHDGEKEKKMDQRYDHMVKYANDIFIISDLHGRIVEVNDRALTAYGYTREELLGMNRRDLRTLESVQTLEYEQQQVEEQNGLIYETLNSRKDGTVFPVEVSSRLVELDGTTCYLAIVRDINGRKEAEQRIRESEEKYRLLFSQGAFAIAMFDAETERFVDVNDSFLTLYGYEREEILGLSIYAVSAEPVMTAKAVQEIKVRGSCRIPKRMHRKKDGTLFPVEVEASALPVQGRTVYCTIIKDITERYKAEESLKRSESKFRAIFDNAGDAIFIHDLRGRIMEANELACKGLGHTLEELMSMNIKDLNPPSYAALIPEQTELLSKSGCLLFETVHIRKDGSTLPVEVSSRIVKFDENPAVLKIVRDISERKFMEAHNQQAQKMEAIGTLAGGIAHDFNNTLGIMMSYAELGKMSPSDPESIRASLDQVLKAGKRAKDLVKQILSFSRQTEQEKTPVYVGILVKESMKLLRASLPASIQIDQKLSSSGRALANPSQIHQVLMNLCTNAAHAMREKGGVLEVTLRDVNLESGRLLLLQGLKPGPHMELTVCDTGHGIDSAILDRIFEPYFTTKKPGEGTGLGLAVVHGIVRGINGAIEVRSQPGKGSCFQVFLPKLNGEVVHEVEKPLCIAGGSESLLIVDDEPGLVDTSRKLLESLGYAVTATTSSLEAAGLFLSDPGKFDLVLTDLTMPDLSGLELARQFLYAKPDARIILCTGFGGPALEQEIESLGIQGLLLKPLELHELAVAVRSVLDGNNGAGHGVVSS